MSSKAGKVKCALFSEDGKLVSPSDGLRDPGAAGKKTVDAELAALRSTKTKTSIFSEDGKLLEKPREVKSAPKVKCSLFSENGTLVSPTGSEASGTSKKTVDAELAALRANKTKTSIFSEDGKLLDKPREISANETPLTVDPNVPASVNSSFSAADEDRIMDIEPITPPSIALSKALSSPDDKLPSLSSAASGSTASMSTPSDASSPVLEPPQTLKTAKMEQENIMDPMTTQPESAPEIGPAKAATKTQVAVQKPAVEVPKSRPTFREIPRPSQSRIETKMGHNVPVSPAHKKATMNRPSATQFPSSRSAAMIMPAVNDEYDDILDGESPSKSQEEILMWSLDAPKNMSDWNIVVENEQEGTSKTYFVHKLILSTGPTKSEHFEKVFAATPYEDSSEITLSRSAAYAFPALLDFMYSREDKLDVNTENAVALRYLGRIFGIRKLVVLCTTFVRDDLTYDKSLHFLNAAAEFADVKVMETSSVCCAGSITKVDREGLTGLEPALFSMVVSCDVVDCSSQALSRFVGEFCRKHEDEMEADLLRVVTSTKNMPTVDPPESVYLLQLSEKHEGTDPDDDTRSDLQERCIESCSGAWCNTLVVETLSRPREGTPYENITPELKVSLLEDALLQAKNDYTNVDAKKRDSIKAEVSSKDETIASKNSRIDELLASNASLQQEIAHLKREMTKFKRLPAEYEFPKKKKHFTYSLSTTGKYGMDMPSALPDNGSKNEGYLFNDGSKRWPIFYYAN